MMIGFQITNCTISWLKGIQNLDFPKNSAQCVLRLVCPWRSDNL